ncbi:MAG: hypothetical protein HOY78_40805 [Saccharothrix sp.]|nr:hypothetical protein [Saccharothrix sp.]
MRRHDEAAALDPGRLGIGLPEPAAAQGERRSRVAERTEMISRDAVLADQATRRPQPEPATRHTEPATRHAEPATRHAPAESATRHAPAESATRHASAESATRHAPAESATRHAEPTTRHASAESSSRHGSAEPTARPVEPAARRVEQTGGFRTVAASSVRQTEQTGGFRAVQGESAHGRPESSVDTGLARPTAVRRAAEMTGAGYRPVENAGQAEAKGRRAAATGAGFRPVTPSATRRAAEHTGEYEPVTAEPAGRSSAEVTGRRRAPEHTAPEVAGAHADGKSVSELLAAFGGADSPRRRRRRGED